MSRVILSLQSVGKQMVGLTWFGQWIIWPLAQQLGILEVEVENAWKDSFQKISFKVRCWRSVKVISWITGFKKKQEVVVQSPFLPPLPNSVEVKQLKKKNEGYTTGIQIATWLK